MASVIVSRGSSGGSVDDPSLIGHRLTAVTGDPLPYKDQASIGTIYLTPYLHNRVALYTGSTWRRVSLAEISLALTATSGQTYDLFLDYNDGTPQLVSQVWAGHGALMTALTNATPMVATIAGHPFQNGDQVYVESTKYTTLDDTPAPIAPNGTWIVANRATDTFELAGSVGAGTWSRGGWTQGRLAAHLLTTQDGVLVRTGDAQQRYIGTFRASGTNVVEDSRSKRFLWNYWNPEQRVLLRNDYDDHTVQNIAVDPSRAWQEAGVNTTQVAWVQGLGHRPVTLLMKLFAVGANTSHAAIIPGIDGVTRNEHVRSSFVNVSTGDFKPGPLHCVIQVSPGYHFAEIYEAEVQNVSVTLGQGGTQGTVWA